VFCSVINGTFAQVCLWMTNCVLHVELINARSLDVSGITILLSLSVFQLIVAGMVPATSLAVPIVGKFFHK
jgi:hypothetical protein